MSRTRVCHFASVHSINDTRVFHRECVSLARHFDVTLIGIGNFTGTRQGVSVIGIPKPSSRIRRILFTRINVFLKAWNIDAALYHIHDAELIPFGIVLSLLGKKVIYDIHENTYGDIMHKPWIPFPLRWMLASAYSVAEWTGSLFMHYILVIANPGLASRFHARRYTIIQNFAELSLLKPYRVAGRWNIKGNDLFYIGTVHDMYYNFDKVAEAVAIASASIPDLRLHCVGAANDYEERLRQMPWYHLVSDRILFHGELPQEQGYEISKLCKAGLCLKDQPEEILVSHERKFFEYIAVALPMVTCDSKIYSDLVDKLDIGRTADLQNASSIAEAITGLLGNESAYMRMEKNCLKAAESHFNWESQARLLADLYTHLLSDQAL